MGVELLAPSTHEQRLRELARGGHPTESGWPQFQPAPDWPLLASSAQGSGAVTDGSHTDSRNRPLAGGRAQLTGLLTGH